MINSMTGYGDAEGVIGGITYAVEIKTVNSRYFKHRIKLPDPVAFLEENIEKLLRKELARGTVNYVLTLKNAPANVLFEIDEAGLKSYMQKLSDLAKSSQLTSAVDVGGLLNVPGILVPVVPDEKQAQELRGQVLAISKRAIDRLKEMRAAEGAALAEELESYCASIKNDLDEIGTRGSTVLEEYQSRLNKRVQELLKDAQLQVDNEVLAREVAIFAERSDISEEIARLESHLSQFAACTKENGQSGRKLDFLSQEMLREANTIASKAADAEIAHRVVNIKCMIDRIKEQVQNIE